MLTILIGSRNSSSVVPVVMAVFTNPWNFLALTRAMRSSTPVPVFSWSRKQIRPFIPFISLSSTLNGDRLLLDPRISKRRSFILRKSRGVFGVGLAMPFGRFLEVVGQYWSMVALGIRCLVESSLAPEGRMPSTTARRKYPRY